MAESVQTFLERFRRNVEQHWDDKTVSPHFLPIDPSIPVSTGQCAPTSILLRDLLAKKYLEGQFSLAIGQVLREGQVDIDYHVWVVHHKRDLSDSYIVDCTADQAASRGEAVVYENMKMLAREKLIVYQAYNLFHGNTFSKPDTLQRAHILRSRYEASL